MSEEVHMICVACKQPLPYDDESLFIDFTCRGCANKSFIEGAAYDWHL